MVPFFRNKEVRKMENPTVNINVTSVSGESRFDGGLL